MKKLLLFFAMSVPLIAHGAWIDSSGKPVADTESMRSAGNFGVQIMLTPDDKQFRQTWNSTMSTPNLNTTDTVHLGASVTAVLIFHGCSPNAAGVCDVAAEFILESPDGTKMPAGGGPVWSAAPLQDGLLQLGQASMTVGFDKTDPVGDYKVIANVKDKISGRALNLIARLKVTK
ncbi:MAG: hypothetical protein NDI73_04090 [Desulfuromonadales bacterium]|nr:hypothetical protein [Desulfuromonadales bacterium]